MSSRFVTIDRQAPMLMPERIQDWVPETHISRFIRGNTHPDHDTICKFRTDNRAAFSECFVKVLAMAAETGMIRQVGGVSVDGTKIKANASKHGAVSCSPNDFHELVPTLREITPKIRLPSHVLADSGYFNKEAIETIETDDGPTVYAAVSKHKHGVSLRDLEKRDDPPAPPADAPLIEKMQWRFQTRHGKNIYKARKQTVEPVFGIIKEAMGFRQFHLRGHPKVAIEWCLVTLAYNIKRMFTLTNGRKLSEMVLKTAVSG